MTSVHLGSQTVAASSNGRMTTRVLGITGLAVAVLLLLLASAASTMAVRFSPAGRLLVAHQTDLALAGVGTLLLTAMLFLLTRSAL